MKQMKTKGKMMIKKRVYAIMIGIMIPTLSMGEILKDADLDGVPDRLDRCPNTPFLNEVNKEGCTTKILTLPQESESTNLTLSLGYGYSTNEDFEGREVQHTSRVQLSYYHDNWIYSLSSAYFAYHGESGMQDTIVKIKKRFKLQPKLKLTLGAGLKLPTYDFQGNNTDYTLYGTLNHYASSKLSYFTGLTYTFVQDDQITTPLQNSYSIYLGAGYFFTNQFYSNLSYSYGKNKFDNEYATHTLATTLYYKINKRYFTTLTYQREIGDEDLHDGLSLKLGIKLW